MELTTEDAFRKMTTDVYSFGKDAELSSKNRRISKKLSQELKLQRAQTIIPKDKDFEFNVKHRSSSLPVGDLTRFDYLKTTKDIGDYISISFASANGAHGERIGDSLSKRYLKELEEVLDKSDKSILTSANIQQVQKNLIKGLDKDFKPDELQRSGAAFASLHLGEEELLVSSLGDIDVQIVQEEDDKLHQALLNMSHKTTNKDEMDRLTKLGLNLPADQPFTRCFGNKWMEAQGVSCKADVKTIQLRSSPNIHQKMLFMVSHEILKQVELPKLIAFTNMYVQPNNPSTTVKMAFGEIVEQKIENDASMLVLFFKND